MVILSYVLPFSRSHAVSRGTEPENPIFTAQASRLLAA